MGTLRTLSFAYLNNQARYLEVVVDLNNIKCAIAHTKDDNSDTTSLLAFKSDNHIENGDTIEVDIPIDQMERILYQHSINPKRRFHTHGIGYNKKMI